MNNNHKFLGDLQTNARVAANMLLEQHEARVGPGDSRSPYTGKLQISVQGLAAAATAVTGVEKSNADIELIFGRGYVKYLAWIDLRRWTFVFDGKIAVATADVVADAIKQLVQQALSNLELLEHFQPSPASLPTFAEQLQELAGTAWPVLFTFLPQPAHPPNNKSPTTHM